MRGRLLASEQDGRFLYGDVDTDEERDADGGPGQEADDAGA
jgi:hypothetical protein